MTVRNGDGVTGRRREGVKRDGNGEFQVFDSRHRRHGKKTIDADRLGKKTPVEWECVNSKK